MTDFKSKLARLGRPSSTQVEEPPTPPPPGPLAGEGEISFSPSLEGSGPGGGATEASRLSALRARLDNLRTKHTKQAKARAPKNRAPLPGTVEDTPYGPMHRYHEANAPDASHGTVLFSQCLAIPQSALTDLSLDPTMTGVVPERLLFLDTETTGLAGGAGTLPFLIGAAWFEAGALQVEQLLLRKPGEEEPMLRHLHRRITNASAIVTYNGKSFDWPLLRNRFVLNRVPLPPAIPHLDVLHCARRVFKHRRGPMRLTNLEASELGFNRVDDIDGALIPTTYFRFLRGSAPSTLTPILTHNRHDLAALVALLALLAQRLTSPEANENAADCLALAQLSVRAGAKERALAFAQAVATQQNKNTTHGIEAQVLCAKLLRQQGDIKGAVKALHGALDHPHAASHGQVHLALAKLYEHKIRDIASALHHAAHTAQVEGPAAHAKRLERLRSQLAVRMTSLQ